MTNPTGYWCPVHGDCQCYASIPVYTPLAVPEVTTIDDSDIADGMVMSIIGYRSGVFRVVTPDCHTYDGNHWCMSERHTTETTVAEVCRVAGAK